MPADRFVLNAEVSVAFSDEDMEEHVREQTAALKALYLSSSSSAQTAVSDDLEVEREQGLEKKQLQFVIKRGLQVVGVATYSEDTGQLTDVAIRPSAASDRIGETLIDSVRKYARKLGRSNSLIINPRSTDSREMFRTMGFTDMDDKMISQLD